LSRETSLFLCGYVNIAGHDSVWLIKGTIMTNNDPVQSAGDKSPESGGKIRKLQLAPPSAAFRQTEPSDHEMSSEDLNTLLDQVSKVSISELDGLIVELQTLRKKLQTDRDRIQRDIATYSELTKQVMQVTEIITDSVRRLPGASRIQ
jgi:hypothetical protein